MMFAKKCVVVHDNHPRANTRTFPLTNFEAEAVARGLLDLLAEAGAEVDAEELGRERVDDGRAAAREGETAERGRRRAGHVEGLVEIPHLGAVRDADVLGEAHERSDGLVHLAAVAVHGPVRALAGARRDAGAVARAGRRGEALVLRLGDERVHGRVVQVHGGVVAGHDGKKGEILDTRSRCPLLSNWRRAGPIWALI